MNTEQTLESRSRKSRTEPQDLAGFSHLRLNSWCPLIKQDLWAYMTESILASVPTEPDDVT